MSGPLGLKPLGLGGLSGLKLERKDTEDDEDDDKENQPPLSASVYQANAKAMGLNLKPYDTGEPYRSRILVGTNRNNRPVLRKIAPYMPGDPSIYVETGVEARVYKDLQQYPDHAKYLLPFRRFGDQERRYRWINFDRVEGMDLVDYIKKTMSSEDRRALVRQMATALQWLAGKGYLHGDIKADNFYVLQDGSVRLMDLGSAKVKVTQMDGARAWKYSDLQKEQRDFYNLAYAILGTDAVKMNPELPIEKWYQQFIDLSKQQGGRRRKTQKRSYRRHRKTHRGRRR